jgi:hypothetical protein
MFCPECEAEYRAGCARCSDCDVALVEHLKDTDVHSSNPELSGTPALLWTGTDSETRAGIIEALETAKISYHTRSDKVGALRNWPQQVYAIFTHARDHHAARAALEAAVKPRLTIQTKRRRILMRRPRKHPRTTTGMTRPTFRSTTFPKIAIRPMRPRKSGPARTLRLEKI